MRLWERAVRETVWERAVRETVWDAAVRVCVKLCEDSARPSWVTVGKRETDPIHAREGAAISCDAEVLWMEGVVAG